jgi:hypothetical protein
LYEATGEPVFTVNPKPLLLPEKLGIKTLNAAEGVLLRWYEAKPNEKSLPVNGADGVMVSVAR